MSNPPNGYNSDVSYNKFKGSYFNDDIDVSGGDIISRSGDLYLAPNSSIYTSANQIQFNEEFQFTDFIDNVNVLGQLKNTYNSIDYDVGLQCEKAETLLTDVATISPIVYDTAFKCTNFYYDQASNSTVWSGLLTCPIASITSTAIANTTRFIEGTGNQTVGGIKRFISNIRIDAAIVLNNNTLTITNANLQKIQFLSTVSSDIQTQVNTINSNIITLTNNAVSLSALNIFSGATNTFTNNIRLDGSLLLNAGGITITNANLQKLQYISTISSDIQTQITTLTTNSASLSADNTFLSPINTFNNTLNLNGSLKINNTLIVPQSTLFKLEYLQNVSSDIQGQINAINGVTLAGSNIFTGLNQFTNNIRLDGSLIVNNNGTTLTNSTLNKIQYLSNVSSDVNTSITNLNTSVSTLNTKTTRISYMSVGGINTTTILDGLISQTFSFTNTINNISTTVFGYLSGATSNLQTQINNITGVSLSANNTFTGSNTFGNITFTGSLNNIIPTVFSYLSNLSGNIQDQLNNLGGQVNPTGSIIMSPLSNIETSSGNKYLLCNGQNVGRTTYANLFSKIGTTFGVGDGSTTFNLPNYQGLFIRGMGSQTINGIVYTGVSVSTAQQDSIQNHEHLPQTGSYLKTTSSASSTGGYGSQFPATKPDTSNFANTGLMASGRNNTTETRPVNVGIYYYVKT